MLKEFSDALKECPWYGRIFEPYPVVMLYVTGSMLYEVTDERSDYDLIAICDVESIPNTEPSCYFTWKGKKVHWSWLPLRLYTECPTTATAMQNVGLSSFCHIREEAILYKNPQYGDTINALIDNKEKIALAGTQHLYARFEKYVDEICGIGDIDKAHESKMLSHLCRAYFDLTKQPYDADFIRAIKRIRWREVPHEYKTQAAETLKRLRILLRGNGEGME